MSCLVSNMSQEVQEIFQDLVGDTSVSIGAVEKRVSVAVHTWCQSLSEAILSERPGSTEASPVSVRCPSCRGESRRFRSRVLRFTTLCGVLGLPRWVYKCKCVHIHVPWAVQQRLR